MTTLIETVFNTFDKDNSGSITKEELADAFSGFGNDEGVIARATFIEKFVAAFSVCSAEKAGAVFDTIDTDSSGTITRAELENLYTVFDDDASGTITMEEFKAKWGTILQSE